MKKKDGVIRLIIIVLSIVFLAYTALYGLGYDASGSYEDIKLGLDLAGGVSITYEVEEDNPSSQDISDTIKRLQKRAEVYSTESEVYKEGDKRITVDIPDVSDANKVLEELGQPGTLSFQDENGTELINGSHVKTASAGIDNSSGTNKYVVQLEFDEEGTQLFADATTARATNNEKIYIVYNGEIVSSPSVQEPITGGKCQIDGMEDYEAADNLASTIRIGAIPLSLKEVRSNVVGAKLGSEAIETSLIAGVIGFVIIILFMLIVYRIQGLAADIALVFYVAAVVVILSAFQVTLTLPGIAGIILSIGMAVDANVVIFARIKEELRDGKTVKTAIDLGFSKALSAILDGNITTLIAAAVLYFLGSGTVRGFAQTLAIGIVLSMFTALVITKYVLKAFFMLGVKNEKFYGVAKQTKVINFLGKKAICFTISLLVIAAGIVTMIVNGSTGKYILNYSLEFVGGSSTNVTFNEDLSREAIDSQLVPLVESVTGDGNVQTSKVNNTNQVVIRTRVLETSEKEALYTKLQQTYNVDTALITSDNISATVSSETQRGAIIAVVVAAIFILLYIWFRFKDIKFASSSVIPLIHDVLVVLTCYAVFRWSVGNTFIACMLTIVGYSINATIVVFDRIRENIQNMKKKDTIADIVNLSISQTLSRSIYSSFTTFIMVAVLYVLGVTSIREFALPLMVGIVCGTYSSVCIAGALWYVMKTKFGKDKEK